MEIHGFGFFPNGVELAIPPLFYFYLVSLIQPKFRFTKKEWLHFIPFFISQTYAIFVYIAVLKTHLLTEKQVIANSLYFNEVKYAEEYLTLISTMLYLLFGYKHIQDYKQWLSRNTSDTQYSELGFIKNMLIGLLIIAGYTIINLILNQYLDHTYEWRWQLSHLLIASLVYYMGLVGYKNSDLIPQNYSINPYKKVRKMDEEVDFDLITKLGRAIEEEKVYLNPKLSLQELAKILEVNDTTLSAAINVHYKKNFRSFINERRVEEVKNRLLNEGLSKLSLLGIAKESGFNSEASFYRIFRATTGLTPKQFLAKQVADSHFPKN